MFDVVEIGATMNAKRIRGVVKGTYPNRGFFWIMGEDGVKYFAHQVQVRNWLILDMWEGQGCEFIPRSADPRGPNAEAIEMDEQRNDH
jgi:cold shock CspA family protein